MISSHLFVKTQITSLQDGLEVVGLYTCVDSSDAYLFGRKFVEKLRLYEKVRANESEGNFEVLISTTIVCWHCEEFDTEEEPLERHGDQFERPKSKVVVPESVDLVKEDTPS